MEVEYIMVDKSLELVLRTMNHEEPERVPVVPLVGLIASRLASIPIMEILKDPEKQTAALLYSLKHFQYDGVLNVMDLTVEAEALGASIIFASDNFPYISEHPLENLEDATDLSLYDGKSSRLDVFVETTKKLVQSVGDTHLVCSYVIGPFTLAGHLLGVVPLLEMTLDNPDSVKDLVDTCVSILQPYVDELVEAGAHNIVILEPTASNSVISPKYFEVFSAPYVKKMIHSIHSKDTFATLHICGETIGIIEGMCGTGADALSIDTAVNLSQAKEITSGKSTLIGNVDTSLLLSGSPQDVRTVAEKCIADASSEGSYILSSACDFPIEAPRENLKSLVDAAIGS